MKRLLMSAALLLAACATTTSTQAPKEPAKLGTFGVDLAGRDLAVKPGDDFAQYAGGTWMKANQIPPDRSRWGMFDELRSQAEEDVRAIVQEAAANPSAGAANQKIGDYYNAYVDQAAIDAKGLEPAKKGLAEIAALKTHEDVAALIARPDVPANGPIGVYIDLDEKNPDRYVVGITQAGLSMPDREYYLKDTPEFREIRAKFEAHVAKMLELGGVSGAKAKAKQILALETEIAKLHWDRAKTRERDLTYNPLTMDQLKSAISYPWDVTFKTAGIVGEKDVIVRELSAMEPLAKLFKRTPVATWKSYLTYTYLNRNAPVLPKAIDDESFDFYGRTLTGQPQQRERWKRAVQALEGSLGEAVGQIYVSKHFPPDSKAKMADLVENLRKGYAERIKAVPWMTEETKKAALEKLATFRPKIGYPDRWRDYAKLEVKPGDAFGNRERAAVFNWNRDLDRLGKPSDRDEWFMSPQTVNAYYNPVFNEIVFPAAILQAPFFDPNADPAVNYGAIGGVIGHEMGHGFDDQGAKSDAMGVLRNWWKPEDEAAFKARTDSLVAQYEEFEPLPGQKINGRLTLGENIGDLAGLTVAHRAYELSLNGKPAPVIDGYSGDQRFFLGWAQVWRTLTRDQALRNQLLTDPHSPGLYRANGVVRNMDQWYAAFDVKPEDKLYVPPEKRVKIW
jgi:predicted metalloendopeptidase